MPKAILIAWFLLCCAVTSIADDSQTRNLVLFIQRVAVQIGGAQGIGTKLVLPWDNNPEVKQFNSYNEDKQIVAIIGILDFLDKNESFAFPNTSANSYHLAASVLARIYSLQYLTRLTPRFSKATALRKYLTGENASLRSVLDGYITYDTYRQLKKVHEVELAVDTAKNIPLAKQIMTSGVEDELLQRAFANKITLQSIISACRDNLAICEKL